MTVNAFNGEVQEGDHYTDFKDFDEARDNWHLVDYEQYLTLLNRNNVH